MRREHRRGRPGPRSATLPEPRPRRSSYTALPNLLRIATDTSAVAFGALAVRELVMRARGGALKALLDDEDVERALTPPA